MVSKADFSAGEWLQVLRAPQMASLVIIFASPSGPVGAIQEMVASSMLFADVMKTASGNALIDAVAADLKDKVEKKEKLETPEMSRKPDEITAQCLQACRDLAALLARKAPAEAEGFKQWVYKAAVKSSEAAKEGGFMGFGGEKVSEAEKEALKQVASALGI